MVETLMRDGFRIWYDEGIDPGSEWNEVIAEHLNRASLCVALISENAVASHNCRREINYALLKHLPLLSVFLEKTKLTPGMEMQLNANQCVFAYEYTQILECLPAIVMSPAFTECLGEPNPSIKIRSEEYYSEAAVIKKDSSPDVSDKWFKSAKKPEPPETREPQEPAEPPEQSDETPDDLESVTLPEPVSATEPEEAPAEPQAQPEEPHMACVLLIGVSETMGGKPIDSINRSVQRAIAKIHMDQSASQRVDLAIVELSNETAILQNFTPVAEIIEPVALRAAETNTINPGIMLALDMVNERSRFYSSTGTPAYGAWIFMITDSAPDDNIDEVADRIREYESGNTPGNLKYFALGVGNYDKTILLKLTNRVMELTDDDFEGIFNWISESILTVTSGQINETVKLGNLPSNARIVRY